MMALKRKVIALIEQIAGDRLTSELRAMIAEKTIQIVEEHYLNAAKVLVENSETKVTGSNDKEPSGSK